MRFAPAPAIKLERDQADLAAIIGCVFMGGAAIAVEALRLGIGVLAQHLTRPSAVHAHVIVSSAPTPMRLSRPCSIALLCSPASSSE